MNDDLKFHTLEHFEIRTGYTNVVRRVVLKCTVCGVLILDGYNPQKGECPAKHKVEALVY